MHAVAGHHEGVGEIGAGGDVHSALPGSPDESHLVAQLHRCLLPVGLRIVERVGVLVPLLRHRGGHLAKARRVHRLGGVAQQDGLGEGECGGDVGAPLRHEVDETVRQIRGGVDKAPRLPTNQGIEYPAGQPVEFIQPVFGNQLPSDPHVLEGIHTDLHRLLDCDHVADMRRDPHAPSMSFGDHRPQHRKPGPHVHLEKVHAGVYQLRGLPAGRFLVVDYRQPPPRRRGIGRAIQYGSRSEETGPVVLPCLESPEHLVGVEVAGVPNGGDPVAQQGGHEQICQPRGILHLQERVVGQHPDVNMAVDEARDDSGPRYVHDFGAGG